MNMWKKRLSMVLGASLLVSIFSVTALAAESRTKISRIDLTVDSSIAVGENSGSVDVTANGDSYRVTDVNIVNDEGEWTAGDVPRVEVTVEADHDYYFVAMSSSKVKLRGSDATYVTSHREDSSTTLILTIKLDALEGSMEIDEIFWENDNTPIARWEESGGTKNYQVRLYRGSSSVSELITTANSYYDFTGNITRTGEYYFKVRAVNSNSKKGDWYESDYIYVDEQMLEDIRAGVYTIGNGTSANGTTSAPAAVTGTWKLDHVGWWYQYPNGSYPTNGWLLINNVWYCFDSVGYMRTGWIQTVNGWYYCDVNSGAMLTNTRTPDGYYVNSEGLWIP